MLRRHRTFWACGIVFAIAATVATWLTAADQPPPFRPIRVVGPLPPITNVQAQPAEAGDRKLGPTELVLGVTVNGESRAYPINALTGPRREIINDTLGGRPIAATW